MIGDGHAVRVSAHIVEDLLGTGKGALGIDYPVPLFQVCAMLGEGGRVTQGLHTPQKPKFSGIEGLLQGFQEQASE